MCAWGYTLGHSGNESLVRLHLYDYIPRLRAALPSCPERCCPTRASLLTGLYPHQAGMGWMTTDLGHDGYRGDLNLSCRTIAEVLRTAGYSTYMAGKWHVTKHKGPDGPKHNWPRQRGFDRFFGTISGAGSIYTPSSQTCLLYTSQSPRD